MSLEEVTNMLLKERKKKGIKQVVFLSDVHTPFEDKNARKSVRHFLMEQQPDHVVFGGDIIDFYSVSKFDKDPSRKFDLQDELLSGRMYLSAMKEAAGPQAKLHFLEGNHENRLVKYLMRHPELAGLEELKTPNLLHLPDMGISYTPYDKGLELYDVLYKHGTRANMHGAKAELDLENMTGVSGHLHRIMAFGKTDRNGPHMWYTSGCLLDIDQVDYITNQVPNWQNGFTVVETNTRSGLNEVSQPVMDKGKSMFQGNMYNTKGRMKK